MLYYLFFYLLRPHISALNVFRYITVRTAMASTSGAAALAAARPVGHRAPARFASEAIHSRGRPARRHQKKAGTPTMGGVLIVAAIVMPTLLWADLRNPYVLLAVGATLAFGTIGFVDDYNKVVRRRNLGLTPRGEIFPASAHLRAGGRGTGLRCKPGACTRRSSACRFSSACIRSGDRSLLIHHPFWPLAFVPFVLFLVLVIGALERRESD